MGKGLYPLGLDFVIKDGVEHEPVMVVVVRVVARVTVDRGVVAVRSFVRVVVAR